MIVSQGEWWIQVQQVCLLPWGTWQCSSPEKCILCSDAVNRGLLWRGHQHPDLHGWSPGYWHSPTETGHSACRSHDVVCYSILCDSWSGVLGHWNSHTWGHWSRGWLRHCGWGILERWKVWDSRDWCWCPIPDLDVGRVVLWFQAFIVQALPILILAPLQSSSGGTLEWLSSSWVAPWVRESRPVMEWWWCPPGLPDPSLWGPPDPLALVTGSPQWVTLCCFAVIGNPVGL